MRLRAISALRAMASAANQLYDPLSTALVNGKYMRTPIPGNIIPPSRIDPVAAKFFSLTPYAPPNTAGHLQQYGPANNFNGTYLKKYFSENYTGRLDQQFTPTFKMYRQLAIQVDLSEKPESAAFQFSLRQQSGGFARLRQHGYTGCNEDHQPDPGQRSEAGLQPFHRRSDRAPREREHGAIAGDSQRVRARNCRAVCRLALADPARTSSRTSPSRTISAGSRTSTASSSATICCTCGRTSGAWELRAAVSVLIRRAGLAGNCPANNALRRKHGTNTGGIWPRLFHAGLGYVYNAFYPDGELAAAGKHQQRLLSG